MPEERKYTFTKSKEAGNSETVEVVESQLTKEQKDILLGDLVNRYNHQPPENIFRFHQMLTVKAYGPKRPKDSVNSGVDQDT